MKTGSLALLTVAAVGLFSFNSISSASTLGNDNASNYSGGWTNGSTGGTGFGAWTLTNNGDGTNTFAGAFIGDSTANNSGEGNINTGGNSFGLYANPNGTYSNADRSFAGGALTIGQTFSLQLAINFRNGGKGLNLYTGGAPTSGAQVINFNVGNSGGGDGYYYSVGNGAAVDTGFAYAADSVFTLSYTQQSATAGLFTISRTSAATPANNASTSVPVTTNGVTSFRVYDSNATNSSSDNLYFNSLAVVPEPGTWATMLLGIGGMAAVILRRRSVAC